jgi:hypothetical protein
MYLVLPRHTFGSCYAQFGLVMDINLIHCKPKNVHNRTQKCCPGTNAKHALQDSKVWPRYKPKTCITELKIVSGQHLCFWQGRWIGPRADKERKTLNQWHVFIGSKTKVTTSYPFLQLSFASYDSNSHKRQILVSIWWMITKLEWRISFGTFRMVRLQAQQSTFQSPQSHQTIILYNESQHNNIGPIN